MIGRWLEWLGYKVGDVIYYVLHELFAFDPPNYGGWDR